MVPRPPFKFWARFVGTNIKNRMMASTSDSLNDSSAFVGSDEVITPLSDWQPYLYNLLILHRFFRVPMGGRYQGPLGSLP